MSDASKLVVAVLACAALLSGRGNAQKRSPFGRAAAPLGPGPDVVLGDATVRGAMSKASIRRAIRSHLNELKLCYEREMSKTGNVKLGGRLVVGFVISGAGQVDSSEVTESTLHIPTLDECVAGAFRRWEFPKPTGGGVVEVSLPLMLKPAPKAATSGE
jgi:outer membrane biosynthesis protein TonB